MGRISICAITIPQSALRVPPPGTVHKNTCIIPGVYLIFPADTHDIRANKDYPRPGLNLMNNKWLAYAGIGLILISVTAFFISGSHPQAAKLLFSGLMCLGSGLILVYIALTGRVPLRGPGSWPHFGERFFSAAFGLLIYLALFGTMIYYFIITIRNQMR